MAGAVDKDNSEKLLKKYLTSNLRNDWRNIKTKLKDLKGLKATAGSGKVSDAGAKKAKAIVKGFCSGLGPKIEKYQLELNNLPEAEDKVDRQKKEIEKIISKYRKKLSDGLDAQDKILALRFFDHELLPLKNGLTEQKNSIKKMMNDKTLLNAKK